jgi:2-phosphosulfolactate phosphatase
MRGRTVTIDCFPEAVPRHAGDDALVAVDVLRMSTTAVTAVALGWRCIPVPTLAAAYAEAARRPGAVLAGEQQGLVPPGFQLDNSPIAVASRGDVHRPLILLSTAGTRLLCSATSAQTVFVACLRNWSAQARCLIERYDHVAIIGAGARGDFRIEDAQCCAWIADQLVSAGYRPADAVTVEHIGRWRDTAPALIESPSADWLRATGREGDLAFTLNHIDDLPTAVALQDGVLGLDPQSEPLASLKS